MKNKFDYYEELKQQLKKERFTVNPYREINYGLQFLIFFENKSEMIRIYENKKGLKLDLSQVKNEKIKNIIQLVAQIHFETPSPKPKKTKKYPKEPDELIGIDESGKGDYFGPLVIAGVYVEKPMINILKEKGVLDSKKCSDISIKKIAPFIMKHCPHSIIILNNKSYNDIYQKMQNLNHILAWGHAKVIESIHKKQKSKAALSDQFETGNLIENALINKGIKIKFFQRPKAEDHIAVAAASFVARFSFIEEINKIEEKLDTNLPKGCSEHTFNKALHLANENGIEILENIAKTHFSLTQRIKQQLK